MRGRAGLVIFAGQTPDALKTPATPSWLIRWPLACTASAIALSAFPCTRSATRDLGLFAAVDFSEIDIVPWQDRVDVRNKRMHVVGTLIGGRLDWAALGMAAQRLLPKLLSQPIPYPSIPGMPQPQLAVPVLFLRAMRAMAWGDQRVAIEWMESPNPALTGWTPGGKGQDSQRDGSGCSCSGVNDAEIEDRALGGISWKPPISAL